MGGDVFLSCVIFGGFGLLYFAANRLYDDLSGLVRKFRTESVKRGLFHAKRGATKTE